MNWLAFTLTFVFVFMCITTALAAFHIGKAVISKRDTGNALLVALALAFMWASFVGAIAP